MMMQKTLTTEMVEEYRRYLLMEEKSEATMGKYLRDVNRFCEFAEGREISKELVIDYKKYLIERGFVARSINSMLASLNSFLTFFNMEHCKVKNIRTQPKVYCDKERELTKAEYLRLLRAASEMGNKRMWVILQTIGSTGIRISELKYFTVESVRQGEINVACKNKTRTILLPGKLRKLLLQYAKKLHIRSGMIFRTKYGTPFNRSSIWRGMKNLCEKAGVKASKVFPHNLRKLFAKTYYNVEKDIAKLADILGHSSINTTRIYIMTSGHEHRRQIERLGLVIGNHGKWGETG